MRQPSGQALRAPPAASPAITVQWHRIRIHGGHGSAYATEDTHAVTGQIIGLRRQLGLPPSHA